MQTFSYLKKILIFYFAMYLYINLRNIFLRSFV